MGKPHAPPRRKKYRLVAPLRFTEGETLDNQWSRLLGTIVDWRAKRGKSGEMLNVILQSGPEAHPGLYRSFADPIEADADLDAWTGELRDYILSFQLLDGTDCRDLIREREPDGRSLLSDMKFTPMVGAGRGKRCPFKQ